MIGADFRKYLLSKRQALLIDLGAIEDYLGIERTVIPKHKREKEKKNVILKSHESGKRLP
jgi:hypothetical protein